MASWIAVHDLAVYRHLMSLGVHALHVGGVITLLGNRTRRSCGTNASQAACQGAGTGSNRCAASTAEGSTGCSPYSSTYGGASHSTGYRSAARRISSNLVISKLPAEMVVITELVEASSCARQGHHAGTRWHTDTGGERSEHEQREA